MHGDVCPPVEQRRLHFAGEDADAAKLAEGRRLHAVASGGDMDDFYRNIRRGRFDQTRDMIRLPQRKLAGTGCDANGGRKFGGHGDTGIEKQSNNFNDRRS